jgi:hypothetical protein
VAGAVTAAVGGVHRRVDVVPYRPAAIVHARSRCGRWCGAARYRRHRRRTHVKTDDLQPPGRSGRRHLRQTAVATIPRWLHLSFGTQPGLTCSKLSSHDGTEGLALWTRNTTSRRRLSRSPPSAPPPAGPLRVRPARPDKRPAVRQGRPHRLPQSPHLLRRGPPASRYPDAAPLPERSGCSWARARRSAGSAICSRRWNAWPGKGRSMISSSTSNCTISPAGSGPSLAASRRRAGRRPLVPHDYPALPHRRQLAGWGAPHVHGRARSQAGP